MAKDETLAATSKVKRYLKETHNVRIGTDALAQLNEQIKQLLATAAQVAGADRRTTIKPRDFA